MEFCQSGNMGTLAWFVVWLWGEVLLLDTVEMIYFWLGEIFM